jgi:regulator of sigma E protease
MRNLLSIFPFRLDIIILVASISALVIFGKGPIVLFFVILLVLVVVHEFGHFIAAKLTGMRVDEFAVGFPPRIYGKKYGETTYAINALPLGGYVSIYGENSEHDEAKRDPRAFGNRPVWAQLVTLSAGVIMNMVLALAIFIWLSYGNVQVSVDDPIYGARATNTVLMVVDAHPESPAFKAGIVPGSVVTSLGNGQTQATLTTATSTIKFIADHQHDPLAIEYVTPDGTRHDTVIAAVYGLVPNKKAIGVTFDVRGIVTTTPLEAISLGTEKTVSFTTLTLAALGELVKSIFQGENVIESLSGPIGIARIVTNTSTYGVEALLTLVAILSINLAIFNALPIPALDGGRFVIVVGEALVRRKLPYKYLAGSNAVGIILLIILVIVVTIKDIMV